jgi:hypothetical protein
MARRRWSARVAGTAPDQWAARNCRQPRKRRAARPAGSERKRRATLRHPTGAGFSSPRRPGLRLASRHPGWRASGPARLVSAGWTGASPAGIPPTGLGPQADGSLRPRPARRMLASRTPMPRTPPTPPRAARPGARAQDPDGSAQDPGDHCALRAGAAPGAALRAGAAPGAVRHSGARPAEAPHGGISTGSGPHAPAAAAGPRACRVRPAGSRSRGPGDLPALARPDGRGGRARGCRQTAQSQTARSRTEVLRSRLRRPCPPRPRPGPERAPWPEPDTRRSSQRRDLPGGQRPHPARSRHLRRASAGPGRLCRWPGRPASACPILLQRSAGRGLWPRPTRSR